MYQPYSHTETNKQWMWDETIDPYKIKDPDGRDEYKTEDKLVIIPKNKYFIGSIISFVLFILIIVTMILVHFILLYTSSKIKMDWLGKYLPLTIILFIILFLLLIAFIYCIYKFNMPIKPSID